MNRSHTAFFLRLGLAFSFIYAAISGFLMPASWVGYFPAFLTAAVDPVILLYIWNVIELLIGLWLLSGIKQSAAGIVSAVALLGVVVFNFSQLTVLFRDISLFFAAVALTYEAAEEHPHIIIARRVSSIVLRR